MKFKQKMQHATFLRRYKRFLVDVKLSDGGEMTVHCPNTGSMRGCLTPGNGVCLSRSDNPKRKYVHTLEMIMVDKTWVGINTYLTNHLVREAMEKGLVKELGTLDEIRSEVKVSDRSRLDFLVRRGQKKIYIEVKNCTLVEDGTAMFPDAVTERGRRHLQELMALKQKGWGAALIFCVQRMDADRFRPAVKIDPVYSETLAEATEAGVGVWAYQADVGPEQIEIVRSLPVYL